MLARVTSEPLPVRASLHQDLTKQAGQAFSRRGRTLTVEGFHECDGDCRRRAAARGHTITIDWRRTTAAGQATLVKADVAVTYRADSC